LPNSAGFCQGHFSEASHNANMAVFGNMEVVSEDKFNNKFITISLLDE